MTKKHHHKNHAKLPAPDHSKDSKQTDHTEPTSEAPEKAAADKAAADKAAVDKAAADKAAADKAAADKAAADKAAADKAAADKAAAEAEEAAAFAEMQRLVEEADRAAALRSTELRKARDLEAETFVAQVRLEEEAALAAEERAALRKAQQVEDEPAGHKRGADAGRAEALRLSEARRAEKEAQIQEQRAQQEISLRLKATAAPAASAKENMEEKAPKKRSAPEVGTREQVPAQSSEIPAARGGEDRGDGSSAATAGSEWGWGAWAVGAGVVVVVGLVYLRIHARK